MICDSSSKPFEKACDSDSFAGNRHSPKLSYAEGFGIEGLIGGTVKMAFIRVSGANQVYPFCEESFSAPVNLFDYGFDRLLTN